MEMPEPLDRVRFQEPNGQTYYWTNNSHLLAFESNPERMRKERERHEAYKKRGEETFQKFMKSLEQKEIFSWRFRNVLDDYRKEDCSLSRFQNPDTVPVDFPRFPKH